ncbi:fibronectin type III domain-containing protein, partial [Flexithrix dorotheae]|uniref:fibronectin type III domain-containing protein n=1 Tax=Flexithrix dorotheae TaxID=70993 RepID=UPI00146D8324
MIKLLQIKNKLVLLLCLAMLSHTLFGAATNEKSVDPVNTSSTLSQSHQIFSVGDVLMVVGNTTLGTGDAALKSELENMGFTVVVKQDSDAQTSDASGKLLVLISSTVNSGNVGTKFTSVAVPLINWEQGLFDELNITSGATGTRGNASGYQSVIINDASHPLAAGLSGTVQVYTSSGTMPWVMVAGDGVNIASHVADGSSVVYGFESGDNMYNSFVAPAKRVGWFLYDTEASMLTADGWALVRASIHWATDDIANSDEEAPSVPENITHTAVTENSISLSWDVATDNIGVTGYKIYQDNNFITEISITSHTINSLVSSTSYSFEISAVDEAGNESARSSAYAISTSGETEAPSIPGNLQVSNIQGDRLNLSWTASTDNVGVSSYEVFKDDVLYGNVSGTSLIIQGLSPETTYSFKVEAIDAAGNRSGKSAAINATTISNINIPAHETQLFSKQNGNWANLSTWSTDAAGTIAATSLPNGTTQVVIKGHEITLNSGPQESGDLYIYDEGTPGKLTINNAKLTVKGEVS